MYPKKHDCQPRQNLIGVPTYRIEEKSVLLNVEISRLTTYLSPTTTTILFGGQISRTVSMEATPREARWEALDKFLEQELANRDYKTEEERRERLKPYTSQMDSEERWDYTFHLLEKRPKRPAIEVPPLETYQEKIQTRDFRDDDQIYELTSLLNNGYAQYIPLGTLMGISYRLIPGTGVLISDLPTKYKSYWKRDGSQVLSDSFLAMNPHIVPLVRPSHYPRSGREDTSPTESNAVSALRSEENDGFVFFQLGYLEYTECPLEELENRRYTHDGWIDSKFAVVLRLTPEGIRDGVYIVFCLNFLYVDPCDGERSRYTYTRTNYSWGYLPKNPDTQIFYAKIADRFEDLAEGKEFSLTHIHQRAAELTRVVRTPNGIFMEDPKAAKQSQRLHKKAQEKLDQERKAQADSAKSKAERVGKKQRKKRSKKTKVEREKRHKDEPLPDSPTRNNAQAGSQPVSPPSSDKSPPNKKHRKGKNDAGSRPRSRKHKGEQKEGEDPPISPPPSSEKDYH
ncbi:hypothetical protein DM02DRAFT_685475 [Periconia macrospinosa]|uniref:Uncharacterized protein n=1 Tax=Periconia macrospinosa TaxID=97972 RepID=A0A2V1DH34_9PLEO|nr:hypothetical protein DM02DRAFT_685475 [Periconia macrospinosa]